MSRLDERFARLRERGERALIPFVTAGDPSLTVAGELVTAMADAGADAIEIGIPFSDPQAEGPTIQRSSERALRQGASLRHVIELVAELRGRVEVPLILMGYANNFLTFEPPALAADLARAGVDGIIVVDLPPEEGEALYGAARAAGVDPVLLAAPTTTPERLGLLCDEARGFLYYVSLTGVTGARAQVADDLEAGVARARARAKVPVCVGFGVSTPEQARHIGSFADGVVVGSALVDRIARARDAASAVDAAARFVAELKAPLRDPLPR